MGRDPLVTEAGFLQRFDLLPEYGFICGYWFLITLSFKTGFRLYTISEYGR